MRPFLPHILRDEAGAQADDNVAKVLELFGHLNSATFGEQNQDEHSELEDTLGLLSLIGDRVTTAMDPAERHWALAHDEGSLGRHLVATKPLAKGTVVFEEKPLIVAEATTFGERALRGEMAAVAVELLRLPRGRGRQAAEILQEPKGLPERSIKNLELWALSFMMALGQRKVAREDGSQVPRTRSAAIWALGVSSVNTQHAESPTRGVLGVLSSLMAHSCEPACEISIGEEAQGSMLTLRTTRAVEPGESLSITYLDSDERTLQAVVAT